MLKFVLLSSQGDPYYIGLNGIEIYDDSGRLIELSEDQLQAAPYRSGPDDPSYPPSWLTFSQGCQRPTRDSRAGL